MENNNTCSICKKRFSKYSNLRMHLKKFHPDKIDEIAPIKTYHIEAVCNDCGKTFSKYSNLTQHVKKFHSDKICELIKPKAYRFECEKCQKHFLDLKNLKNHRKCHTSENIKEQVQCYLCDVENFTGLDIIQHFQLKHNIELNSELLHFTSYAEFNTWKCQMERETNSYFINKHGSYSAKDHKQINYMCHRSGFYKSKGKGLRHLKMQGTNKIDGYCPAKINLKILNTGECEVNFMTSHIGHTNDLGHLSLRKLERDALAAKIAAKIPFQTILDNIRESVSNDKLNRVHLLTKKDLYNIEQSYNLNKESVRHVNDAVSVEAWVKEVEDTDYVLFYKPQDTLSDQHPQLKHEDFILIIMHSGQKDMLEKYGSDVVCIDGTHGLNSYQFELVTILVLDDMREGFPAAFFISNRTDEIAMRIFFSYIKETLGRNLKAKTFMSDMAPSFYNAWVEVMGPVEFRLYCSWHVDRAWRKNLCKINSKEQQVSVYKQLRTLLQETDINAFNIMCHNFLSSLLSSQNTIEFGLYFQDYYAKNTKAWAYCYRINSGINTNMFIERMHRTLKYIYLGGKVNKRLDKAINILMKFVRDKLFDRLILINKGKLTTKITIIRDRHKASQKLDCKSVVQTDMGWQVPSSSSRAIYIVEERQPTCSCKLMCTDCQVCFHRFSCTCLDSSVKWNMCKHVHLVCTFLKEYDSQNFLLSVNTPHKSHNSLTICENVPKYEEQKILETLTQEKDGNRNLRKETTLESEKEKLKSHVNCIIDSIQSCDQLEAFKKLIRPAESVIAATKRQELPQFLQCQSGLPHNKKIEQQRRLYKTKKSNKKKRTLNQPDAINGDNIAVKLLYPNHVLSFDIE